MLLSGIIYGLSRSNTGGLTINNLNLSSLKMFLRPETSKSITKIVFYIQVMEKSNMVFYV